MRNVVPPRPSALPDPFEQPAAGAYAQAARPRPSSPAFDDPFSLDPLPSQPAEIRPNPVQPPDVVAGFEAWPAPAEPPTTITTLLGMPVLVRPHVPDGEVWILDHKGETVLGRITYARGADADS